MSAQNLQQAEMRRGFDSYASRLHNEWEKYQTKFSSDYCWGTTKRVNKYTCARFVVVGFNSPRLIGVKRSA